MLRKFYQARAYSPKYPVNYIQIINNYVHFRLLHGELMIRAGDDVNCLEFNVDIFQIMRNIKMFLQQNFTSFIY